MATQGNRGCHPTWLLEIHFSRNVSVQMWVFVWEKCFSSVHIYRIWAFVKLSSAEGLLFACSSRRCLLEIRSKDPVVSGNRHKLVLHFEPEERLGEGTGHVLLQLSGKGPVTNAHRHPTSPHWYLKRNTSGFRTRAGDGCVRSHVTVIWGPESQARSCR